MTIPLSPAEVRLDLTRVAILGLLLEDLPDSKLRRSLVAWKGELSGRLRGQRKAYVLSTIIDEYRSYSFGLLYVRGRRLESTSHQQRADILFGEFQKVMEDALKNAVDLISPGFSKSGTIVPSRHDITSYEYGEWVWFDDGGGGGGG